MRSNPAGHHGLPYTHHALRRMQQHALLPEHVEQAIVFGRRPTAPTPCSTSWAAARSPGGAPRACASITSRASTSSARAGVVIPAFRNKQLAGYRRFRHAA